MTKRSRQSRIARAAGLTALGTGAAVAAAWAAQRRLVSRSLATDAEIADEGLVLPDGVEHRYVDVDDGGRIHVASMGHGDPIVLLHGVFLNSGIWSHQFSDLSSDHTIIALDLRGHGESIAGSDGFGSEIPGSGQKIDAPVEITRADTSDVVGEVLGHDSAHRNGSAHAESAHDAGRSLTKVSTNRAGRGGHLRRHRRPRRMPPPAIERMAEDVRQVLDALDVERAVLVGHSMGGMVTIQAVAGMPKEKRRKRLSGLVLTSTTTGPFLELPGWDLAAAMGSPAALRIVRSSVRAGRGVIPGGDFRWWASRLAFGAEAPATHVRFLEAMLAEAQQTTMEGLLESLARVNLSGVLGSIDVPTLVTVGTHDRLTPPWHARRLESGLPDARLVELARCGHMPMLERRREFDRLLDEHARKVS